MPKYIFIIVCCFGLACKQEGHSGQQLNTPSIHTNVQPDSLITPGKSIGNIHLHDDALVLIKRFGQPDKADAAMGASLMVWYAHHDTTAYQLGVYSHRNFGAKDEMVSRIKQIRVSSPSFKTQHLIGTGISLDTIRKYFAPIKKRTIRGTSGQTDVYDDAKAGIAFEIDGAQHCSAIIVHAPGDSAAAYLNMQE